MQNQIKPTKILIVQAIFYQDISKMLLDGAIEELNKSNITFDIINLSGALEIPVAIAITLEKQKH